MTKLKINGKLACVQSLYFTGIFLAFHKLQNEYF